MLKKSVLQVALACILLLTCFYVSAQINVIYYVTFGGDSYRAEIVKSFTQGDPMPRVLFKHTKVSSGETHLDDHIDYMTDAGLRYSAKVFYNQQNKQLYFQHTGNGETHSDVIMFIKDFGSHNWKIELPSMLLEDFQSQQVIINLKKTDLGGPVTTRPVEKPNTVKPQQYLYSIERSGRNIIMKFNRSAKARIHAGNEFYPMIAKDIQANEQIIINPGQWIELWLYTSGIGYSWAFCNDADNR